MTTGSDVPLDGELLTVLETLYVELSAKTELERSFEDTVREIQHIIEQMNEEERRLYLFDSLFLNFVSYENERLGAYIRRLEETEAENESAMDQ
jgi:CRISPR/Cas system CMR subunit Cmr4 (Cas7 group RAMP superfamily)